MARRHRESGVARQRRIEREQHRPEQNAGYDEAVRGQPPVKLDITATTANEQQASRTDRLFDNVPPPTTFAAAIDLRTSDRACDYRYIFSLVVSSG